MKQSIISSKFTAIYLGLLALLGLYLTSLYSYLLFHSLVELFSVVIACGIFMIAWNSRRFLDNNYLLYLGIAYLFIGVLDLVHTLAYAGMGVFQGYTSNLPTQLWIAARYVESLSLLIAFSFLGRRLRPNVAFLSYTLVISLLLVAIFWNIFPQSYIEGVGLTPFKKISEYVISLILLASIVLLVRNRTRFDRGILRLLIASLVFTIGSELAFTFYISVFGISNLIGHLFKIISFYLIYKAIIETGIRNPFNLLFRNLKQNEAALQKAKDELEVRVKERTNELSITNEQLTEEIDQRKLAEKRMGHLNLVLRAIRNVNQLIIVEKDRNNLIKRACDSLIETRGYYFSWIILLDKNNSPSDYAESGLGKDFAPMVGQLKRGELPNCCRQAVRQPGIVVMKDLPSTCSGCPISEKCRQGGVMALRLESNKKVYGILVASVSMEFVDDEEEQALFKEVAGDISFALHDIELEEERKQAEYDMKERVKELVCLYGISAISQEQNISLGEMFQRMVELLPPGWQYPEITCARLIIDNQAYCTRNFRETNWKQISEILVHDQYIGTVEVCYLEERPECDEGPFLKEERDLINAIANHISQTIEHKKTQEQLMVNDRLATIGELVSGIAHEMNNPLTGVIGFSELLLDQDVSDEIKKDLIVINNEAKRTSEIVRGLLTFARKQKTEKQAVAINSKIQAVLDLRAYEQKVNNIGVDTHFAADLSEIMANGSQLQQVFLNIVINAEQAILEAHKKGNLTITTEQVGNILRI